jgi:lipoprotein-releasing system ATP-binding protein
MNVITAKGLKKYFSVNDNEIRAVDGVDFSIDEGETVAIVGPSGSGKSTLLHIMGLMETPTDGSLLFRGMDVSAVGDDERAALRNKDIGFVFQYHFLLPEFTLLENILIPVRIAGGAEEGVGEKRALELLNAVGLGERLNHTPAQLSGGEQQRAAVVRALINSPKVLLADEPTGNLDLATGDSVLALMTDLARRTGAALVIVTHNADVAARASRTVRLLNGRPDTCLTPAFAGASPTS